MAHSFDRGPLAFSANAYHDLLRRHCGGGAAVAYSMISIAPERPDFARRSLLKRIVVSGVSSNVIPWIMFASVSVACVSAFFSWRSSKVAANASQAALYLKFQEQYASHGMRDALRNLSSWRELHGGDFAHKWGELYEKNDTDALEVDKSRRRVSHFFGAIADLYKNGLLSKPLTCRLANYSGADLWFEVVEPLEEQLGCDYDRSQFETLRSLRDSSGRTQPRWFKPVIVAQSADIE